MAAESDHPAVLTPLGPLSAPCKCCDKTADLFGVVDFHKSCEDRRRPPLRLSGIPIYYHRCPGCGFLFTTALDTFTRQDFAAHIYNEQYILVDPDYAGTRPRQSAQVVHRLFSGSPDLRVLDYGGGAGQTAQALRDAGFQSVFTYDPFNPSYAARPQGTFDLITCFEVMEHTPQPRQTLTDLLGFLREPGLVLFSTLFQPPDIERIGINWWYVAPRNGHVSLFTPPAMIALLARENYRLASFNNDLHLMHRRIPPWAAHLVADPAP